MMKTALGAVLSPHDVRDYKIARAMSPDAFPQEFELNGMPEIKDQGATSSCVAHSIATTIEYYSRKQGDDNSDMSVGYIYGNRRNSIHNGHGMIVRDALAATTSYGDVPEKYFPYNLEIPEAIDKFESVANAYFAQGYPNRISSYYRCYDIADIKTALTHGYPIIFAMHWHDLNFVNQYGILHEDGQYNGDHCMIIYGWNTDGWKIQNSWGTNWGDGGRAILPYEIEIAEAWGVTDNISENLRKRRIDELEGENLAMAIRIDSLNDNIERLMEQLSILGQEKDKHVKEITEITRVLEESKKAVDDASKQIVLYEQEIENLQTELIEIKRPFESTAGKIFAKIINVILNAFNALFKKSK